METSNSSIDRMVRFKRKMQTLALFSGLFTCISAIALVGVNYRLDQLNAREIDELNQMKEEVETSAHIKNALAESRKKIDTLTKQLNAELSLNASLKKKLSQTLKQLAQLQEYSYQLKSHSENQGTLPSSSTPGAIAGPHPPSQSIGSSEEDVSSAKSVPGKDDLREEVADDRPQQSNGSQNDPLQSNQSNISEPSVETLQESSPRPPVSMSEPPTAPKKPTAVSAGSLSQVKPKEPVEPSDTAPASRDAVVQSQ